MRRIFRLEIDANDELVWHVLTSSPSENWSDPGITVYRITKFDNLYPSSFPGSLLDCALDY